MLAWLASAYVWLKALHIIAVIAWMAGLLYLPRLFVYHAEVQPESESAVQFKIMERRLLRRIVNPAGIAVWVFGGLLFLAVPREVRAAGWLHAKLALVVALTVLHILYARWRRDLERGESRHSSRFYRVLNEVPALLVIVIVILAVVKPF